MRRIHLLFSLFICCLPGLAARAQSAPIFIDEAYSDWNYRLASFRDAPDNPGGFDLLEMQVANDDRYLYVKIVLDQEIDLTDNIIPQELWLYLDTDNDPSTGFLEQTGYGAELAINFQGRYAWFNVPNPDVQVTFGSIGLQVSPTVTSPIFEIAIDRNALPNGQDPLFLSDTIRVLVKEKLTGDAMPDVGTIFDYVIDDTPISPLQPYDLPKVDSAHIRVVSYNVLLNGGWVGASKLDHLEAVVKALDADVYAFQESRGASTFQVQNYLNTWLPLGTNDGWYAMKSDGMITCSKWPITQTWTLWRQLGTLIDLPASYPQDLLLFNAHLSCCGADDNRQAQVDEFAAFMLDAKQPGGMVSLVEHTPLIYAGDLNLVGFSQQLETLLKGEIVNTNAYGQGGALDWDGTDLADAKPYHADENMVYTWRNRQGNGFPPGRLDYQIYTNSQLQVERGFVLQTETMNPARLKQYRLDQWDTYEASDHLPVVVDYSFVKSMPTNQELAKQTEVTIFPNPTTGLLQIETTGNLESAVLTTVAGGEVLRLNKGEHYLDVGQFSEGIYFLQVVVDQKRFTQKVVILKP